MLQTAAISGITLTATLLHAVLGCCWHHDHAAHGGRHGECGVLAPRVVHNEPADVGRFRTHACGHRHDKDAGNNSSSHAGESAGRTDGDGGHPRHNQCGEGACKYVAGSKVSVPDGEDGRFEVVPQADATLLFIAGANAGHRWRVPAGDASTGPPPRPRPETTQVWLL